MLLFVDKLDEEGGAFAGYNRRLENTEELE
jgi:hypothetical protein